MYERFGRTQKLANAMRTWNILSLGRRIHNRTSFMFRIKVSDPTWVILFIEALAFYFRRLSPWNSLSWKVLAIRWSTRRPVYLFPMRHRKKSRSSNTIAFYGRVSPYLCHGWQERASFSKSYPWAFNYGWLLKSLIDKASKHFQRSLGWCCFACFVP